MTSAVTTAQWIMGILLVLSSLGMITAKRPVYASLSFLLVLVTLSALYLELSAQFIAVMQILVYAGAILVIFMFVIILFQDAYAKIEQTKPQSPWWWLSVAAISFVAALVMLGQRVAGLTAVPKEGLPKDFGTVQSLGHALYVDFFFPFEAVILIFLVAVIGALYIGKKVR